MESRQYRELLDIAVTPMMKFDYYKNRRNNYNKMINPKEQGNLPEKPADYYIKAESTQARDLMFSVFRAAKRSYGHG